MTMVSHLAKRVRVRAFFSSCFYSCPPRYQTLPLLTSLLRSHLSTQTQTQIPTQPQKELPFIAEYLISSFGLSPDRALKYSAHSNLAPIKSPARPQALLQFLSDTGLTDAQVKVVISLQPILLGYDVDKTIKPKVRELVNKGCSPELLVQLIRYNPHVLYRTDTHSRVLFWRDFFGKDDEALLKIISRNGLLFTLDTDKHILPRINLLKEYGLSNPDILVLLQKGCRFMNKNLDSLRRRLQLVEELGILRGSTKFRDAFKALAAINEDATKRKVEFFKKTYGWSQDDVNSAFRKFPNILSLSEENLKSKIDFLIEKAGIQPSKIASDPGICGYSLEGVLMARYNVLSALKAKGLMIKCSFLGACRTSEKQFYERYVVPFKKDLPGICQAYMAARGVKGRDDNCSLLGKELSVH